MPIATKNNALILTDGKLAENCGCCRACSAQYSKLRITLNNLPANCLRNGGFLGSYVTRDLPTLNGCSFIVFRNSGPRDSANCSYQAQLPGPVNYRDFCGNLAFSVALNPNNETLSLYWFGAPVILKPENGKSFQQIPYSGGVTVESLGGDGCAAADWNAATVSIDIGEPQFIPSSCLNGTECVQGTDTLPSPPANTFEVDIPTCAACEPDRRGFVNLLAAYPHVVSGVDELNVSLTFGDINVQQPPANWGYLSPFPSSVRGFKSMSGTYALKWSVVARFRANDQLLYNQDFTGYSRNSNNVAAGCGWEGTFYWKEPGQPAPPGKGYEFKYPKGFYWPEETDGIAAAAVQIAVVPIGWHMPYNTASKQYTNQPCQGDTVAYQVRVNAYYSASSVDNGTSFSPLNAWRVQSFYDSVPCQQRACRSTPSFSVNKTVYMNPLIVFGDVLDENNAKSTCTISLSTS